jgi:hypothetical protein
MFTQGALSGLLEYYRFRVEKAVPAGFFPLPVPLARAMCLIGKRHATKVVIKARKKI